MRERRFRLKPDRIDSAFFAILLALFIAKGVIVTFAHTPFSGHDEVMRYAYRICGGGLALSLRRGWVAPRIGVAARRSEMTTGTGWQEGLTRADVNLPSSGKDYDRRRPEWSCPATVSFVRMPQYSGHTLTIEKRPEPMGTLIH